MAYALNTTLYQNGKMFATFANIHAALLTVITYFNLPETSPWHIDKVDYKIKHHGIVVFNSKVKEDRLALTRDAFGLCGDGDNIDVGKAHMANQSHLYERGRQVGFLFKKVSAKIKKAQMEDMQASIDEMNAIYEAERRMGA